ncbi:hypothetical protein [Pedobacter sp.]|uniref:hypothetical protein n=1 Tax=Pedobacter sp. TaxID=1411316 RepID=UPI003D7F7EE2
MAQYSYSFKNSSSALYGIFRKMIAIFTPMKAFAIFMTIMIFLTGLDLCEDNDAMNSKNHIEVCSPFCHCAHCPISTVLPQELPALHSFQPMQRIFSRSDSRVPTQMSPSVWQPPKFA